MQQHIMLVAVTVRDYDEAIAFYVDKLGFELLEDTDLGNEKRWVRVRPRWKGKSGDVGAESTAILLARAVGEEQLASVGRQTGGRVFLFLQSDDFWRDYDRLIACGVTFVRPPKDEPYGTVAVFEDLYGNLFDLVGPTRTSTSSPGPAIRA